MLSGTGGRVGKEGEATDRLQILINICLQRVDTSDPAGQPWREADAWQHRWESLNDADLHRPTQTQSSTTGVRIPGLAGWDGMAEALGSALETPWLDHKHLKSLAVLIDGLGESGLPLEALQVAKRLLYEAEEALPSRATGVLAARHIHAYWTGEAGDRRLARTLTMALAEDCRSSLGADHPLTRLAHLRSAAWMLACSEIAAARRTFRALVEASSENNQITLLARWGGAVALSHVDAEEAADRIAQLLPALKLAYGTHHVLTYSAQMTQVMALHDAGHVIRALRLANPLIESATDNLGIDHPLTLRIRGYHAGLTRELNSRDSLELAEAAHRDCRRTLGDTHPDTLVVANVRAVVLSEYDPRAALALWQELVVHGTHVLGAAHQTSLVIAANLAVAVHELEGPAAARPRYEAVLETQSRILGQDHPDTLNTWNSLAVAVHELEGPAAARPRYEAVLETQSRILGQ
ncbi:tetratricopeptide repeat protein, partial [Streptomyces sp. NPDC056464]